jgi:tight adherence protein B
MNQIKKPVFRAHNFFSFFIFAFVILLLTHSVVIGVAYGFIGSVVPTFLSRRGEARRLKKIHECWPEIIDNVITGLNTGLTLSQSLSELAFRGPEQMRDAFSLFRDRLIAGFTFEFSLAELHSHFQDPLADQILIIIEFARNVGARDTVITLRNLGEVVRSDLALRGELVAKQGWIKNSALIAALAPWILLVMLSRQNNVAGLYSTPVGIIILIAALFLTAVAYLWMEKVGQMPVSPRIFSGESINNG